MSKIIKRIGRTIKQFPDRLRYPQPTKTFGRFGSEYAGWWIETAGLGPQSQIIAAGVGDDITFDLAVIHTFGCHILAFDPTPKAVAYVKKFRAESGFHFEACGLAEKDGEIALSPPENPQWASFSVFEGNTTQPRFTFPAKSLKTILAENRWAGFDLVKMDIEGSEYGVIDSIIREQIPIKQLCIEFHDAIAAKIGRSTPAAIRQLEDYGLKLVYKEDNNYTFLNAGSQG
jgi:FkbM family methyltransferase